MGFTSPAEDYREEKLDFNRLLVDHPAATFSMRVHSPAMEGLGIFDGDIVVVDRSLQAKDGSIVVANWQGEFLLRRLIDRGKSLALQSAHPDYDEIEITGEEELMVFGVACWAIRHL